MTTVAARIIALRELKPGITGAAISRILGCSPGYACNVLQAKFGSEHNAKKRENRRIAARDGVSTAAIRMRWHRKK